MYYCDWRAGMAQTEKYSMFKLQHLRMLAPERSLSNQCLSSKIQRNCRGSKEKSGRNITKNHKNDSESTQQRVQMVNEQEENTLVPQVNKGLDVAIQKDDLVLMSTWAKNELFEKVKFIYNPEKDLRVNGMLYNLFVSDCKARLVGLKSPIATGEYRKMYVQFLWQEGNKRKVNLVANGLTTKRSGVSAAMQIRFVGKLGNELIQMI
jgi:hypothetical protein